MSREESIRPIFQNKTFWLKIGVDFYEAKDVATSKSNDRSEELLNRFLRGKRKVIDSRYESIRKFKNEVRTTETPEDLLFSIYAETLWMKNWDDGIEFEPHDGDVDTLLADLDSEIDYEEVDDEFGIIWPTKTKIRREKQDGEVIGTRPNETDPVVVKKSESSIKVRASSGLLKTATGELEERDDVAEVEPELASKQVTGNIQDFLSDDNVDFNIIGVKFNESELPERSRIRIKNERAVYDDLEMLSDMNVVSTEGISAIQKIYLRDERYGGKYRIKIIHGNKGFRFELEAPEKLEQERERFKDRFTNTTNVRFDVIYEYGSQNQRHLFNRTLSGDGEAYDRYYDQLNDELKGYVDEFTDVTHRTLKICFECSEAVSAKRDRCGECRSGNFSESFEQTDVTLNQRRIATHINNRLNSTTPAHVKFDVSGWMTERREMNSRYVVQTDFHTLAFEERGSSTSTPREVFFVPQGNQSRPSQINNYLLKCVYVTYGDSAVDDYEGYGRISLFELLTADELAELVGGAIHDAVIGTRVRTFRQADKAHDEAKKYLNILAEENSLTQRIGELEDHYSPENPDYFEKHVFYLSKGLFFQTERWGRNTEKEADGLLIIPRPDSRKAYAAKLDPKFSHQKDGYPFGTGGEDQASRYMSNGAETKALRAKADRDYPSAHILISQNFNETRFPIRSRGVQNNLDHLNDFERPDLVFLEFDALVELYQLELDHHEKLDNPDIKGRFRELTIKELTNHTAVDGQEFVHFNQDSVRSIRDRLLAEMDKYDYEPAKKYSK